MMRRMFKHSDMAECSSEQLPEQHRAGGSPKAGGSPRPNLEPQQSMHDMSDVPTANGLAKKEITKFTDTWNSICKNSLVGQGKTLQSAAIASHTGNIFSCYPEEFLPTIKQIETIVKAMSNPSLLATSGMHLAGDEFRYTNCQVSGSSAHFFCGERADGNGGVLIYITKVTILIGVYNGEGEKPKNAAVQLMDDIWEWIRDTGF